MSRQKNPMRSLLLAVAVMAVPAALAFLAVHYGRKMECKSAEAKTEVSVPEQKSDPLRFWMQQANNPAVLLRIEPPFAGTVRWHFTQNPVFAVAVSAADEAGRRNVGVCDVVSGSWLWKSFISWPENHETPVCVDGCVMLAFTARNGLRFMLRTDAFGEIQGMDALESGRAGEEATAIPEDVSGVVIDSLRFRVAADKSLQAVAAEPFPGYNTEKKSLDESLAEKYEVLVDEARKGNLSSLETVLTANNCPSWAAQAKKEAEEANERKE